MNSKWSWLDVFKYCRFLRLLGHVMVLLVLGIVAFTYYTVVALQYGPGIVSGGFLAALGCTIVVVIFSVLVFMLLWAYFAAVTTDPGRVPPGWHPFQDEHQARAELERMAYSDYYFDRRDPRRPRYCKRCQAWKPERAHHCSVSGHCVLKMDHYCIWVVNCVGLLNYKHFLLFLFYTFWSSLLAVVLLIHPMVEFFTAPDHAGNPLAFIVVVTDGAFAASVGGFLIMHYQLLAANCTTIEMYEKDRIHPWPYNRGLKRNFEEVFGRGRWRWLLPMTSKEEKQRMVEAVLNPRLLTMPFNGNIQL